MGRLSHDVRGEQLVAEPERVEAVRVLNHHFDFSSSYL
jgi:hypothetical protein